MVTKPTFGILTKQRLFSMAGYFVSPWSQAYDVSADDQQFLMMRVGSASGEARALDAAKAAITSPSIGSWPTRASP